MTRLKPEKPQGVLHQQEGTGNFSLSRYIPSGDFSGFVEHFWIVRWDLRGKEPFRQDVLSHPSVHLVFEKENTKIWGVVTGKFTRILEGKGHVLGIKFRPGGFYPFIQKPVASFTNNLLSFQEVFDEDTRILEKDILSPVEDELMIKKAEEFLLRNLPEEDPAVEEVAGLVEQIMNEPAILKVDDLVESCDHSKRKLQRLFRKYVGASPKWAIQRYRLHEAAEKIAAGKTDNWPSLALELGYFDQAHFIRDFKAVVGQTPAEYVKSF